jgi:hypothetical protein
VGCAEVADTCAQTLRSLLEEVLNVSCTSLLRSCKWAGQCAARRRVGEARGSPHGQDCEHRGLTRSMCPPDSDVKSVRCQLALTVVHFVLLMTRDRRPRRGWIRQTSTQHNARGASYILSNTGTGHARGPARPRPRLRLAVTVPDNDDRKKTETSQEQ